MPEPAAEARIEDIGQTAPIEGLRPVAGMSRVTLLADGDVAFAARVASARAAESTLDLQYYLWHGDVTGKLMAREALMAADRGVRVRILIDDLYGIGRERDIASLSGHPRISLRWFNTSKWGRWGWIGLLLEFAFGSWHLNRRMHNKAWIADRRTVICGGRNIGDRYFDAPADFNFRDLDVSVTGPAAEEATALFEEYWRSPLARPLRRLPRMRTRKSALKKLRRKLDAAAATPEARALLEGLGDVPKPIGLSIPDDDIHILADPPGKVRGREASVIAPVVHELLVGAQREALLISPYFVPGEAGTEELIALRRRGVRVSVITNSLVATDVVAVHGGYARYRARLLAEGVEIHELKAIGEPRAGVFGSRGASLHTKAVMVDDGPVMVGSFNLDPRSVALNTEMGVLVKHAALARMVRRQHARLTAPLRSWKLSLARGKVVWEGAEGSEPEAGFRRRLLAWLVRRLPVESQL
ncbi:phospholipase D family protein [Roseococcus pinisoli]|uniref:Phospholipase D n=1 Tax=Roseococcus pinisoli TaxID=2835040 RepID=A0ABS5QAJ6_9PROT|nr:phospholipase D family protein [Roseococcus pinisoli]MBS7810726.1 phospholipase D family protein [Roseococcus pinisoli]